ncbi:MAG TPA: hypothetical protein ENK05_13685 [Gammaproteobacteria bacterium]|nr:hypothetical protein [Gammaproteobacteria bacterium]
MNDPECSRIEYCLRQLADAEAVNAAILAQYQALRDDPALERSHWFGGRYENVYVPRQRLPALEPVLRTAVEGAADFLRQPRLALSVGFWMNEMGPGHVTLPHTHDEDDELVSGVYYLRVPQRSGELLLYQGPATTRVTPREGLFVFFPPQVRHEVTENCSGELRLSIGMNFGVRRDAD